MASILANTEALPVVLECRLDHSVAQVVDSDGADEPLVYLSIGSTVRLSVFLVAVRVPTNRRPLR